MKSKLFFAGFVLALGACTSPKSGENSAEAVDTLEIVAEETTIVEMDSVEMDSTILEVDSLTVDSVVVE